MLDLIFEDCQGKELWVQAEAVQAVAEVGDDRSMILVAGTWLNVKGKAQNIKDSVSHVQQHAPLLHAVLGKAGEEPRGFGFD